jgi:hypothetical protein
MNIYETLTVLASIGVLITAIASYIQSKALKKRQSQLQAKQEDLIDIQLKLHKREAEASAPEKQGPLIKAAVRVSLEGTGRSARFVTRNWGFGPAKNVELEVNPISGKRSPIIASDYNEKFPIPRLAPGGECSLIAALSFDTGTSFDVVWSWENEDGMTQKESSRVSL